MRTAFINFLLQQAEIDKNLYLIVGDVGFSVIETFKERFKERYINAGISEQAMIGIAAGLAMAGKNVYVYSIIPFVTMRCFEQIRNDLCYQQLPVKLVGVGGGFSYGPMGVTHHALEDVAIMRILPGMTVIAPGSVYETIRLMPQINNVDGPAYIRLSNIDGLVSYNQNTEIKVGKVVELVHNPTQTIIASGNALDLGFLVQKKLAEQGMEMGLVSMPTIKPLDHDFLTSRPWKALFTLEEHFITGGLGESIARTVCEISDQKIIFQAFGVNDFYFHEAGSRSYLKEKAGLAAENIASIIMQKMKVSHVPNTHILPQQW